jgi:hypothetical protein
MRQGNPTFDGQIANEYKVFSDVVPADVKVCADGPNQAATAPRVGTAGCRPERLGSPFHPFPNSVRGVQLALPLWQPGVPHGRFSMGSR